MVQYTDKQKAAYYKRKATMVARPQARGKPYGSRIYNKAKSNWNKGWAKKYDYPGVGKKVGRYLGENVGGYIPGIGGTLGGALGAVAGQGAHALVKRISGFGDYHVSKNSLVYNRDAVPEFSNNNERCTMVVHREFITDIVGSSSFNIQSYRINPGVADTFPWLAAIAENYEQYVVQGMVFEFKTTSATAVASTNTALGTVVMATQYNSLAPNFINKQQMENYEFACSSVPSNSILHPIECDPTQTQCGGIFNVNAQVEPSEGDKRLYDVGRFSIATVGMQAESTIGELWVSYKICFLKPRLRTSNEGCDFYVQTEPGSVTAAAPMGPYTSLVAQPANSGITTPITNTEFDVDVNFSGILQCLIVYNIASGVTGFTSPYWVVAGGSNSTDVTDKFTNITPTEDMTNSLAVSGSDTGYSLGYFQFSGGLGSDATTPYLSLSNAVITGGGCDVVTVSFIALPNNAIDISI